MHTYDVYNYINVYVTMFINAYYVYTAKKKEKDILFVG